jgi:hypothetical protein
MKGNKNSANQLSKAYNTNNQYSNNSFQYKSDLNIQSDSNLHENEYQSSYSNNRLLY